MTAMTDKDVNKTLVELSARVAASERELNSLRARLASNTTSARSRWLTPAVLAAGLAILGTARLVAADSPPLAGEAVPRQIPYRGVLDKDGSPITNPAAAMTFGLYASPESTAALWSETRTVAVVDGVFNVDLGDVTPIPGSVLANTQLYLSVAVDGQVLAGRQRLMSTPYAQRAVWSSTAQNGVPGAGFNIDGQLTARSGNVAGILDVGSLSSLGPISAPTAIVAGQLDTLSLTVGQAMSAQSASIAGNIAAAGRITEAGWRVFSGASMFESVHAQPLAASSVVTAAHGLPGVPTLVHVTIRCVAPEYGYAVGDEIDVTGAIDNGVGEIFSSANATTVSIVVTGFPRVPRIDDSRYLFVPTPTSWRFVIRAWR